MKERSRTVVRWIAAFRAVKAIFLIVSALVTIHLVHAGAVRRIADWVSQMPFAAQHAFVQRAIAKVTRLSPKRIEEMAVVLFLYAVLFLTEAIGLWLDKVWAEWLTIIATTSFIPFEVYETLHKVTPLRIGILLLNVAIVVYLIVRRATDHRAGNRLTRVLRRFS